MSAEDPQWFVLQGEEQLGPYTGAQLVEFAAGGNIVPESMVWAEGMESWLPAGQIEGIFPAAQAIAQPVAAAPAAYPAPLVKSAGFGAWAGMVLGGITLLILSGIFLAIVSQNVPSSPDQEIPSGMAIGGAIALGLGFLGYGLIILSAIPFYIDLYRAWHCLQPGGLARTSPGKAVGFMFIPFFNLYWLFQGLYGLAVDWNRTLDTYPDLKAAPRLSEGVFLTCCIGFFLPPIGFIMMFPVVSQMCKGINFFAFRPHPGQGPFGPAGATGGLKIGGGFTNY